MGLWGPPSSRVFTLLQSQPHLLPVMAHPEAVLVQTAGIRNHDLKRSEGGPGSSAARRGRCLRSSQEVPCARAVLSLNLPHQGAGQPRVPPSPGAPLPRGQGFRLTGWPQAAAICLPRLRVSLDPRVGFVLRAC